MATELQPIGGHLEAVLHGIRARYDADPGRLAREAERAEAPAPVDRTDELAARLAAGGVPRCNWPWILDPAREVATVALMSLRELRHPTIVLTGLKDSGRTGAGSWWVAQADDGIFVHAEQLLARWIRDRDALWAAPRLFLDDLGQEGGTETQQALVREAIDSLFKVRSADLLPTVAATNHGPEAFARYLGDRWPRFKERLVEHGPLTTLGAGFVACPVEGLRAPERRARALELRR